MKKRPIFARNNIEQQLDSLFSQQVSLPSGGYLVINQTEALVAIDVNSGKSTREYNIESTALKTNLETADEIARQLRLRDLAGLVVIDFIDMEEKRNNRAVENRLKDALKNDRARIQVGRISHFGLLEMSRQRMRSSVLEGSTQTCPMCEGRGFVRSVESASLSVLREIEEHLMGRNNPKTITVKSAPETASYILNQKRDHLVGLEAQYGALIFFEMSADHLGSTIEISKAQNTGNRKAPAAPSVIQYDSVYNDDEDNGDNSDNAENTTDAAADSEEEQPRKRRRRRGRRGGRRNNRRHDEESTQNAETDISDDKDAEDETASASNEAIEANDTEDEGLGNNNSRNRRPQRRRGRGRDRGSRSSSNENEDTQNSVDTHAEEPVSNGNVIAHHDPLTEENSPWDTTPKMDEANDVDASKKEKKPRKKPSQTRKTKSDENSETVEEKPKRGRPKKAKPEDRDAKVETIQDAAVETPQPVETDESIASAPSKKEPARKGWWRRRLL